jgi:hypothetical protein
MYDSAGCAPQLQILYNVRNPGHEAAVQKVLFQLAAPSNITKAMFKAAKNALIEQYTSWRSESNLTSVLADVCSTHPDATRSVMSLFSRENDARKLTYDGFMSVYNKTIARRFGMATSIHGVSDCYIKEAAVVNKQTPVEFVVIPEGPQFTSHTWDAPHVTVPGSSAYITCRLGVTDEFVQGHIKLQLQNVELGDKSIKFKPFSERGLLHITISSPIAKLAEAAKEFCFAWEKIRNVTPGGIEETRTHMAQEAREPTAAVTAAVRQAVTGVVGLVGGPHNASQLKKVICSALQLPMHMTYFLPKLIENKSDETLGMLKKVLYETKNTFMQYVNVTSTAPVPSLFTRDGTLVGEFCTPQYNMQQQRNVVHEVAVKSTNVQFCSTLPAAFVKSRKDALCLGVIANTLGGGWCSQGMENMRRKYNHCYDYAASLHYPSVREDCFRISVRSTFKKDDYTSACTDNIKFTSEFLQGGGRDSAKTWLDLAPAIVRSREDSAPAFIHTHFICERLNLTRDEYIDAISQLELSDVQSTLEKLASVETFDCISLQK